MMIVLSVAEGDVVNRRRFSETVICHAYPWVPFPFSMVFSPSSEASPFSQEVSPFSPVVHFAPEVPPELPEVFLEVAVEILPLAAVLDLTAEVFVLMVVAEPLDPEAVVVDLVVAAVDPEAMVAELAVAASGQKWFVFLVEFLNSQWDAASAQ